jgi:hypothetical protein
VKDWHQFLREERARKIASIEQIVAGSYRITWTTNGLTTDLSDEIIADNHKHIAEIEQILTVAGEPFDA